MMNTKIIAGAVVAASVLLAGCSNSSDRLDAIEAQLNQLSNDVQVAKAEAARANQRLDNLSTTSYRK